MRGKHHIIIETNSLKYEFDIRRNITVIQGDSATGKTTLIELLAAYSRQGIQSGVRLQSDVPCIVYGGSADQWEPVLRAVRHSIVFIDEDYRFVFSREFAALLDGSDNYFVIITRKPLKNLPYSINEIYGIRTSGKYHFPQQIYHEFYPLYPKSSVNHPSPRQAVNRILLTEDSNAGFQFFRSVSRGIECISAGGNSNIIHQLMGLSAEGKIAVIADGAAFGAFIDSVVKIASQRKNVLLYFPESFEWLILKSGVISSAEISDILDHPEDYIESSKYISWERFFTDLLKKRSQDNPYMLYHKEQLPEYYTTSDAAEKILKSMPPEVKQMIHYSPAIDIQ